MLKGVNKYIIEVSNPESEFFERAIFFVKPDKSDITTKALNESVQNIINGAGNIRTHKKAWRQKKHTLLKLAGAAGLGAVVMGIVMRFLML